jgi:hypothetical protein
MCGAVLDERHSRSSAPTRSRTHDCGTAQRALRTAATSAGTNARRSPQKDAEFASSASGRMTASQRQHSSHRPGSESGSCSEKERHASGAATKNLESASANGRPGEPSLSSPRGRADDKRARTCEGHVRAESMRLPESLGHATALWTRHTFPSLQRFFDSMFYLFFNSGYRS